MVANPDTLADLVQSRTDALSPTAEKFGEIVDTAYESALVQLGLSSNPSDDGRAEPAGKAIDLHDEDAVRTHFPRLAELRKTLPDLDDEYGDDEYDTDEYDTDEYDTDESDADEYDEDEPPASQDLRDGPAPPCAVCGQPLTREALTTSDPYHAPIDYRRCTSCRQLHRQDRGDTTWTPATDTDTEDPEGLHIIFDAYAEVGPTGRG